MKFPRSSSRTSSRFRKARRTARSSGCGTRASPVLNGSSRGDLFVHVDVKIPARLTREQRKLMEQLRETLPVDNAPAEKGLFEKVKDYFM